ncbi:hypothetical protein Tco_1133895 [Tanacetum coccineum]
MSKANPQAAIVSEEQLVLSANRLMTKKNNQRVASDSNLTDTLLKLVVGIRKHHKLYKLVSLTTNVPVIYLHHIPRRSDVDMHSKVQDSPLTKLINTVEESEKGKVVEEPVEQHISPVRSRKGKGYMRFAENEDVLLAKSVSIKEQRCQQPTDSDTIRDSSCSDTDEEKDVKIDDFDDLDMDSSDDEPKGDDDVAGFGVFMYNKSIEPLKSTYLSHMEMFLDDSDHPISSPPANTTHNPVTNPQQNSLQAKAKKLMEKDKKNIRKITFRKAVAHKFKEYDQKLEALSSIKVSEAIEEAVEAKVLTEIKK